MDTFLFGFHDELEKLAELTWSQRNPRKAQYWRQVGPKYTLDSAQARDLVDKVNRFGADNHARGKSFGMRRGAAMGVGGTLAAGALGYGGYKLYQHLKNKKKKKAEA